MTSTLPQIWNTKGLALDVATDWYSRGSGFHFSSMKRSQLGHFSLRIRAEFETRVCWLYCTVFQTTPLSLSLSLSVFHLLHKLQKMTVRCKPVSLFLALPVVFLFANVSKSAMEPFEPIQWLTSSLSSGYTPRYRTVTILTNIYAGKNVTTVFTRACNLSLSWATRIRFTHSHSLISESCENVKTKEPSSGLFP
jgi:hypothetical protein